MANQDIKMRVQYSARFNTSGITKGLQDIKKQMASTHIADELKKQLEDAFKKVEVNIPALEKLSKQEEFNLKDLQAYQKLIQQITKDWEGFNKIAAEADFSAVLSTTDLTKLESFDKQIKEIKKTIADARQELVNAFSKDKSIAGSKNISNALIELFSVNPNEIDNKFQEINKQFTEGVSKTEQEVEAKLASSKIHKTGASLLEHFFGEDSDVTFVQNQTTRVVKAVNDIVRAYRGFKEANDEAGMTKEVEKLKILLTDAKNFSFPEGETLFGLPTQEDLATLGKIGEALEDIKTAVKNKEPFFTEQEAKAAELENQKLTEEAKIVKEAREQTEEFRQTNVNLGKGLQEIGNKADEAITELERLKRQGEALESTFGSLARRIENSVSALAVFNKATQIVRGAINSVKELDAAFTQIAIVSEQSNESAWKMFDSFNKLAKQYSITTKDLTEGAKLFYQQGLSAADTMKMVEASTVSAALGEVTMTEAANTLTAAIQGYNESAAVAMDYTDKIAMVGAVSAADFNELSTAMEKTASSAYTAGIDFDHLLGYLGKMIEVTREAYSRFKGSHFNKSF